MTIGAVATTALSSMQAQNTRLSATASNIANADTIGYSHLSAQFSTASTGGVQTQIVKGGSVLSHQASSDLSAEMTDMIGASLSMKANAVVFETGADLWEMLATRRTD